MLLYRRCAYLPPPTSSDIAVPLQQSDIAVPLQHLLWAQHLDLSLTLSSF